MAVQRRISLHDVKQALLDERFRSTLPESLIPDVDKFLSNPSCLCNHPIYKKVMQEAKAQLMAYYPTKEITPPEEIPEPRNEWTVISCKIHELAGHLRNLPMGRKQLDIARWQDEVTVVINDLGF
jgi:hypothetical protein